MGKMERVCGNKRSMKRIKGKPQARLVPLMIQDSEYNVNNIVSLGQHNTNNLVQRVKSVVTTA